MENSEYLVQDFMDFNRNFVYEDNSLFDALTIMQKSKLDSIPVVKNNMTIIGTIKFEDLKKFAKKECRAIIEATKVSTYLDATNFTPLCLHPRMNIDDAYLAMKQFHLKIAPVIDCLWEKQLLGVLNIEDIKSALKVKKSVAIA
jgi:Mg/Co/Ni transporter MgtE